MEATDPQAPKYQARYSKEIPRILHEHGISLLISTYQAGKVIVVSAKSEETITQIPVPFRKPMGIALKGNMMAVATLDEVHIFEKANEMAKGLPEATQPYDTVFLPRAVYFSGETDLHDIAFGKGGLWAVNTGFSCLSTYDVTHSFRPKWKPPFIKGIRPGDHCHLNGMAAEDDVPRYVTALGNSDEPQGWRKNIVKGGVLMEVPSGEIILEGLGMPHSPRLINGELYVLLSAVGQLIKVNVPEKSYTVLAETGKMLRGMASWKEFLFIGMSKAREESSTFHELPVAAGSTHAGILVFNMNTGKLVGQLEYDSTVNEIFDVQVIHASLPAILPAGDERHRKAITTDGGAFWK